MDSLKNEARTSPRRFRFSLRALFVVFAILGLTLGWLGWNWQIVRERELLRARMTRLGAEITLRTGRDTFMINPERYPMPFPRNWMGDVRIPGIVFPADFPADEIPHIRRTFPEAWLSCDDH